MRDLEAGKLRTSTPQPTDQLSNNDSNKTSSHSIDQPTILHKKTTNDSLALADADDDQYCKSNNATTLSA
jgi:hypothetical protein